MPSRPTVLPMFSTNVGFYGMEYAINVVTADASSLRNRAFAYAFTSSPYIVTAFAWLKVTEEFYYQVSWQWGFGARVIATPIVALPLYGMLKYNSHKGSARRVPHQETKWSQGT
ncbi:hypothetical protein BDW75DRAFT_235816 [Aspergillus navahoensis]